MTIINMNASKTQLETKQTVSTSCRKTKQNAEATFLENVKDHINDFIHSSFDEHKECFKNTFNKMFTMSKKSTEQPEIGSVLPLQKSVSK